jgi:hypothetical protein
MLYSSILALHIAAGSVGLLSGGTAMVFRKGSRGHVLSGRVFVVAMLTMGMAAVPLGLIKHQYANVGGGIMTVYLVGTAWLTMWRKPGEPGGVIDRFALLVPLSIGLLTWVGGLQVLRSGHISKDGVPVFMNFFIGSICLLAAAGDIRMMIPGGVFGVTRLSRHLGGCALVCSSRPVPSFWGLRIARYAYFPPWASDNTCRRRCLASACICF